MAKYTNDFMKLYHYTSIDTLEKILTNRSFRFTNMKDLNDSTEYSYGITLLKESIRLYEHFHNVSDTIDLTMFDRFMFEGQMYTMSFTEREDDLIYWNSYYIEPNNSVSICVDKDSIFDNDVALNSCIYGNPYPNMNDATYTFFKKLFNNPWLIPINKDFIKITYQTALIKNSKFHEEREWRGILLPNKSDTSIFFRRGKQCRYIDYPLNIKGIKSVIIGPSNIQSKNLETVRKLILKQSINIGVERSSIPLVL